MTNKNNEKIIQLLKSDDLMETIYTDMKKLGFDGHRLEILLIYLTVISRLTKYGIYTCFKTEKSRQSAFELINKLVSPGGIRKINSISEQGLCHIPDIKDQCLLMGGLDKAGIFQTLLRDNQVSHLYKEDNNENSKVVTKKLFFFGSAFLAEHTELTDEEKNLFFFINQDKPLTGMWNMLKKDKTKTQSILQKHHKIQDCIESLFVIFPDKILDKISFPLISTRHPYDYKRFKRIISVICILRHYQKQKRQLDDSTTGIEIDSFDYRLGYEIFIHSIKEDDTFRQEDREMITKPEVFE